MHDPSRSFSDVLSGVMALVRGSISENSSETGQ